MSSASMFHSVLAIFSMSALIFGTQWLKYSLRRQLNL